MEYENVGLVLMAIVFVVKAFLEYMSNGKVVNAIHKLTVQMMLHNERHRKET